MCTTVYCVLVTSLHKPDTLKNKMYSTVSVPGLGVALFSMGGGVVENGYCVPMWLLRLGLILGLAPGVTFL
jgi:hypothetical protein